jgi:menaquinone-9 beta-reductase
MHDLIVIGGGPAGTAASITAARAGATVLVLERGRFPRHKVCGEFVSGEALDLLEGLLGSDHKALLNEAVRIAHARIFLDGCMLRTATDPPAASIARLNLDAALWSSAIEAGADARQQTTVHGISGTGPFEVRTSAGEFESRSVINASGRWSNLNVPVPPTAEKWIGVKGHFLESSPEPSVDLYFFEGGYCGVSPVHLDSGPAKHSRVNACAMVRADIANSLPQVFAQHPALRERSRQWQPLSEPVSTSPLIFREPDPGGSGIPRVGDAATFVDPFVGDGVSLALRGGTLAAESLIPFYQKRASLKDAIQTYSRAYQERLAPVFHASSGVRRMLGLPRLVRKPLLLLLGKTPGITRYLVKRTRWAT